MFREQVVERMSTVRHGQILLIRPISHSVITTIFGCVVTMVCLYICVGTFSKKATLPGSIVPVEGLVRLVANQSGYVGSINAREGDFVTPQTTLISLAQKHGSTGGTDSYEQIEELLLARTNSFSNDLATIEEQVKEQVSALRNRARSLVDEEQATLDQAKLQEAKLKLAEANLNTFSELSNSGYISAVQFREKEAEVIELKQRVVELNRVRRSLLADLDNVNSQLNLLPITAKTNAGLIKRSLGQARQELAEHSIRAKGQITPLRDGEITNISVHPGQFVQAGQTVGWLVPKGDEVIIELHGNSRVAGQVRVGMAVNVRHMAFPFEKFGHGRGVVIEVSKSAVRVDDPLSAPPLAGTPFGERLHRIRVKPTAVPLLRDGNPIPLKVGSTVEVSIELEKRRIVEWIFGPIFGAVERM